MKNRTVSWKKMTLYEIKFQKPPPMRKKKKKNHLLENLFWQKKSDVFIIFLLRKQHAVVITICYVKTNILLANVSLNSGLMSSHYVASAKKVDGYLSRININQTKILIVQKRAQDKFFRAKHLKAHFISSSLAVFQKNIVNLFIRTQLRELFCWEAKCNLDSRVII